jgi:hypothetical protein
VYPAFSEGDMNALGLTCRPVIAPGNSHSWAELRRPGLA